MAKPTIALLYDFDKTLSIKDQQEYTFIPSLGMEASEFWGEADKISKENNMDRILSYMFLMIKQARKKNVEITKEAFKALGADVDLLPGVKTWFKRINDYGASLGLDVQHYIISSGVKDIIEGSEIAKEFKAIYACEYMFDKNGDAVWPKVAINYTMKTQYVFRISKGIDRLDDDDIVNSKVSEKDHVREHTFLEKGEIAEGRRNPKLLSGTMQKMQRTVTFSGALSADKEFFMPWIRAYLWLFIFADDYKSRQTQSKKERGKKNESKHEKTHGSHDGCCISCYVLPNAGICCRRNCRICAINVCYFLVTCTSICSNYSCTDYKRSV